MTMERVGDWMQTYTGGAFWPLDPRPDEIKIEDIAHALSMICRFNGHCRRFYSVAEHSCRVAEFVRQRHRPCAREIFRQALLHDAAEAYLGDVVRPIKRLEGAYRMAEKNLLEMILVKYECAVVKGGLARGVIDGDNVLLSTEKNLLMSPPPMPWGPLPSPIDQPGMQDQMSPIEAERWFMKLWTLSFSEEFANHG
jgi:hypothetical protein